MAAARGHGEPHRTCTRRLASVIVWRPSARESAKRVGVAGGGHVHDHRGRGADPLLRAVGPHHDGPPARGAVGRPRCGRLPAVQRSDVQQVADDVFRVHGGIVNWYLLRDGRDLTLVDAGYPGNAADVEASIRLLGHDPRDVRALLVTHAHADHIGAAVPLHARYGTPAWCSPAEVAHARREHLQQVTPLEVLANAWRPGVLPWALHAVRLGGTRHVDVPHAQPFPGAGPLDLPGAPVPVPTPGHTDGHTAYLVPGAGAVLTGDGLVTGHPTSRRTGPQLLPAFFDADRAATAAALAPLAELDADLVLPGHGEPWRGPVAAAVAVARAGR